MVLRCLSFLLILVANMSAAGDLPWSDARQLVLVTISEWNADHGVLRTFSRKDHEWQPVAAAVPITIGREGAAWGTGLHTAQPGQQKKEGDGRSPAGVFRIGDAFGYAASELTQLRYVAMTESDYCIDVASSPLYNQIVDERVVGHAAIEGSTEPMRRDIHIDGDHRYKLGFVIEHNGDGEAELGSCIFAHIWKAPGVPTAGCTAMDETNIRELVAWLDPARKPIFILLPQQEYERLRASWSLPNL
jgi:L,D-peptidoglycan transpeptidase YkuD (ErfK/YbiS/YcfS/YnhG family)